MKHDAAEFGWDPATGKTHVVWLHEDRELTLWERVKVYLFRRDDPRLIYYGEPE